MMTSMVESINGVDRMLSIATTGISTRAHRDVFFDISINKQPIGRIRFRVEQKYFFLIKQNICFYFK